MTTTGNPFGVSNTKTQLPNFAQLFTADPTYKNFMGLSQQFSELASAFGRGNSPFSLQDIQGAASAFSQAAQPYVQQFQQQSNQEIQAQQLAAQQQQQQQLRSQMQNALGPGAVIQGNITTPVNPFQQQGAPIPFQQQGAPIPFQQQASPPSSSSFYTNTRSTFSQPSSYGGGYGSMGGGFGGNQNVIPLEGRFGLVRLAKGGEVSTEELVKKDVPRETSESQKQLEALKTPEVTGMNRVVDFIAQKLNPEWFATSGRTFLETAQGTKTPITEKNFKPEELDVIRKLVDLKGKDRGSVSYADYIELSRQMAKAKGEPLPTSVTPSLFSMADPLGNIQTTLGRFTYQTDPKGNLQVIDRYDFNPPMQQDMREARTGDYGAFGPYGMIREYAGEKIPPGKGRDVRINLGPKKRFEDGGEVNVPRGTSEVPQLDPEGRLIDENAEMRSEAQRMLNRLKTAQQESYRLGRLPPGVQRAVTNVMGEEKPPLVRGKAIQVAGDVVGGAISATPRDPTNPSEAYRLMQGFTGAYLPTAPVGRTAQAARMATQQPRATMSAAGRSARESLEALGDIPVALAQPNQLGAQAGVIKPKGGNWLANAISDEMQNLKVNRFGNDPVDIYEGMRSVYTPEAMSRLSPETLQQVKEGFAALKPQVAINKWIDTKLAKYMQNEFATPEDPVRALIERGISPARNPGDINPIYDYNNVFEKRKKAGFPVEGLAETEAGRNWEEMADSSVNVSSLKDLLSSLKDRQESKYGMIRNEANRTLRDNPWLNKLTLPDTPIYGQLGANYRPVFNHVIDELQNAMATNSGLPKNLQLDPDDLSKMNVPQVVELVDKINKWRVDNIKNLQLEETLKADLYKAYPEQRYRWVQLNRPGQFAAESDAMGHSVRGYEPPDKGGSDYYGLGGFKAIQSGEAKVYSLRDEKGQPHVTIEVATEPTEVMTPSQFYHSDLAPQSLFDRLDRIDEQALNKDPSLWERATRDSPEYQKYYEDYEKSPPMRTKITQIKGKSNEAPAKKYLPFIQDFVKSGNWSQVNDLQNTGMRKTSSVFNETDIAKLKAMGEDVPDYVSGRDILRLQDLVIPEGMRLKYDDAGNIIGRQNPDYFGFKDGGFVNVPRETSTSRKQLDTLAQISQRKKA